MEAISHAGICVGILAKDGIVLAVEKKITSKLLENISSEKMYKVSLPCYLHCSPRQRTSGMDEFGAQLQSCHHQSRS